MSLVDYLDALVRFLALYVAFPTDWEAVAVALWIAHAHVVERFETSPYLAITSAVMRCGKTRLLDCLELLAPRPWRVVTPSEAAAFTTLSERPQRTLLLDEADAIFGPRTGERHEGLRAILNAGNRSGTRVTRVSMAGGHRTVEEFDVYGPKAIAAIGDLPGTVADRSIPIRLKRRSANQPVAKFRRRTAQAAAAKISFNWANLRDVLDVPDVPDELNDRAADSWEPLLAIADWAGGSWPERARRAAVALQVEPEEVVPDHMRLLADVREVLGGDDSLSSAELLRRLRDLDDSPWATWYGEGLSTKGLATLLAKFNVRPVQRRVGGERIRGYFRADLERAFERHLPGRSSGTPVSSETG